MPVAVGIVADSYNKPASGGGGPILTGLVGWWDASDASTFTLTSGGPAFSVWRDKSTTACHFDFVTGGTRNGTVNGLTSVVVPTGQSIRATGAPATTAVDNFTMFSVCRRTGGHATDCIVLCNGNVNSDGYGLAVRAGSAYTGYVRAGVAWHNSLTPDGGTTNAYSLRRLSGNYQHFMNGVQTSVGGFATPSTPTRTTLIDTPHPFAGDLCEFLIYNTALSDADRTTVHNYLMTKWMPPFVPTQIAGLAGWWDASDAASITASGGAVSQWNDKSTNAKHVVQATAGAKPTTGANTVNGKNVITFDGGDVLAYTGTTGLNVGSATVFVVAKETTAVDNSGFLVAHNGTGNDYNNVNCVIMVTGDSSELFGAGRMSYVNQVGTGPTPLAVWSGRFESSGLMTLWRDGAYSNSYASGAGFGVAAGGWLIGGRYIGGAVDASYRLNGQIAEIVVYSAALSDTDRQAVESYLKSKWGTP